MTSPVLTAPTYWDDIKIVVDRSANQATYFTADVQSVADYYPFGSLLPERYYKLAGADYRYGFQGQEKDDEVKGSEGTSINFKYRLHDPRLGRFLSRDPLEGKYPFYTPYSFSGNRVIDANELEGLEPIVHNGRIIAYKVQAGQGPTQIAEDINNPKTQEKYGFSLLKPVSWKDVVKDNMTTFKTNGTFANIDDVSDLGYNDLNINPGDGLWIKNQGAERDNKMEYAKFLVSHYTEKVQDMQEQLAEAKQKVSTIETRIEANEFLMKKDRVNPDKVGSGAMGAMVAGSVKAMQYQGQLEQAQMEVDMLQQQLEGFNKELDKNVEIYINEKNKDSSDNTGN